MRIRILAFLERSYHTIQLINWRTLAVVALVLIVSAAAALAHDWYDHDCCSDQDCAPIPASAVERLADGRYKVTLKPGEHFMVSGRTFVGSPISVRNSMDGDYHACIVNYELMEPTLRCLYKPMTLF